MRVMECLRLGEFNDAGSEEIDNSPWTSPYTYL